jgi:hypothetical protein
MYLYHDRERRKTERDFIMHASRKKETPDCKEENSTLQYMPPETVVVKSRNLIKR